MISIVDITTNPYTNLGNLAFHFVGNAVVWTAIISLAIWGWRFQLGKAIISLLIIGFIFYLLFLISDTGAKLPSVIPTPYEASTPLPKKTITTQKIIASKSQETIATVVATIVPYNNLFDSRDPAEYAQEIWESDAVKARLTEVTGWREQGLEIKPMYRARAYPTARVIPTINADEIDDTYIRNYVSVFGIVAGVYQTEEYTQIISISISENHFQFRSRYTYFEAVNVWMCVYAKGEVQKDESFLYIIIDHTRLEEWDGCN